MKSIILSSALAFSTAALATPALVAQHQLKTITCHNDNGTLQMFPISADKLDTDEMSVYQVLVSEGLSSVHLGEVTAEEYRLISWSDEHSTNDEDVMVNWDGNAGVTISFAKEILRGASLNATPDYRFSAKLEVLYDDIAYELVTNNLVCQFVD